MNKYAIECWKLNWWCVRQSSGGDPNESGWIAFNGTTFEECAVWISGQTGHPVRVAILNPTL